MLIQCLLTLFIISYEAVASPCSEFNLLHQPQSPFLELEVYDQSTLNICYAMAASDLINYELLKAKLASKIHPIWIAYIYAKNKLKKNLDIGITKEALLGLKSLPGCTFEEIQAALGYKYGESIYKKISDFMQRFDENGYSKIEELEKKLPATCFNDSAIKVDLEPMRLDFRQLPDDSDYEEYIDEVLNLKKIPISITYCSNIWRNIQYDGIDFNGKGLRDRLSKNCHYHESIILGKKRLSNQCHFLVRNSWGKKWTKDNSGFQCVCKNKKTGKIKDECNSKEDKDEEVLACWLPAVSLSRNTGAITLIQGMRTIPDLSPPSSNASPKSLPE